MASRASLHATLTVLGLVPGVGEFADGFDALLCAFEGDGLCVTLSLGSAIPFAGWASAGGKFAKIGGDFAEAAADTGTAAAKVEPSAGQTVFRVYGGDSKPGGASWSPIDPGSVPNYRDAAGLPSGGASRANNTGRFVIEGSLNDPGAVVLQRNALPLDGMNGGIPEYIIPNWMENGSITIKNVSGVNPEF